MKKLPIILVVIIILLTFTTLLAIQLRSRQTNTKKLYIYNHEITVEIADNDKERTQGLSGRISLPANHGMLFVFPTPQIYSFWMKDMHFPLDFVWIKDDQVVDLTENVPAPADPYIEPSIFYSPSVPADNVLEINAGDVEKLKIKIGDTVRLD